MADIRQATLEDDLSDICAQMQPNDWCADIDPTITYSYKVQ